MDTARNTFLASVMVLISGTVWGFYWLPVREIDALGLTGAWGSVAIVAGALLVLSPFAWRARGALRRADLWGVLSVALGGFSFFLYSVSFLYGQVAVVVILFFLTPVWSTLIGRAFLGWPITQIRLLVLFCGLLGLAIILGGEGLLPIPRGLGEWLGLVSGVLWSVASIGIRVRPVPPAVPGAFVFALGAFVGGVALAVCMGDWPDLSAVAAPFSLTFWFVAAGAFWWALMVTGLMWAAPKLDPARIGILHMIEVPVAAASAAVLVSEHLTTAEFIGGALVVLAGLLEVWPARNKRPSLTA